MNAYIFVVLVLGLSDLGFAMKRVGSPSYKVIVKRPRTREEMTFGQAVLTDDIIKVRDLLPKVNKPFDEQNRNVLLTSAIMNGSTRVLEAILGVPEFVEEVDKDHLIMSLDSPGDALVLLLRALELDVEESPLGDFNWLSAKFIPQVDDKKPLLVSEVFRISGLTLENMPLGCIHMTTYRFLLLNNIEGSKAKLPEQEYHFCKANVSFMPKSYYFCAVATNDEKDILGTDKCKLYLPHARQLQSLVNRKDKAGLSTYFTTAIKPEKQILTLLYYLLVQGDGEFMSSLSGLTQIDEYPVDISTSCIFEMALEKEIATPLIELCSSVYTGYTREYFMAFVEDLLRTKICFGDIEGLIHISHLCHVSNLVTFSPDTQEYVVVAWKAYRGGWRAIVEFMAQHPREVVFANGLWTALLNPSNDAFASFSRDMIFFAPPQDDPVEQLD